MKKLRLVTLVFSLAACSFAYSAMLAAEPAETPERIPEHRAEMSWWRDAKFGLFIHWGLYSVPAGEWNGKPVGWIGEWIMNTAKIPVAAYAKLAEQFNPAGFNADEWVSMARDAGMKYIVITAKHHDGFAMFHTKVDGYNIHDATPFHRDPLMEIAEACKKHGMKLGVYYSQSQDWHHPGGAAFRGGHWDKAQDGDYDTYLRDVAEPQIRELLTRYGSIAELWFDTPDKMTPERVAPFVSLLKLQSGIVVNDRLGDGFKGDIGTPEQTIPATGIPGRDWESCMTINGTWGFKKNDTSFKSTATLLRNLIDIVSKGGNYLLNVGPASDGVVPAPEVERLRAMGAWLKTNGEAIYGTTASPFTRLKWGRATRKPGKLFLHVLEWPKDGKLVVPLQNPVSKAYLLTAPGSALNVIASGTGALVTLPATAPDPIASVVVLEVDGDVLPVPAPPIESGSNGIVVLGAADADLMGNLALEGDAGKNVGHWADTHDHLEWKAQIGKPGIYKVSVTYSILSGWEGSEFLVQIGSNELKGKVQVTGGWSSYRTDDLGVIQVQKSGPQTITLKALTKPAGGIMNLRSVTLEPGS